MSDTIKIDVTGDLRVGLRFDQFPDVTPEQLERAARIMLAELGASAARLRARLGR